MFSHCTYSAASVSSSQVYPSEYAYRRDSVYRSERDSANCRTYPNLVPAARSEDYIHCDGTQLRLADSDFGPRQYTTSEYYVWPAGSRSSQRLLFIFPIRINLTTITLHYYHASGRGLPRLRFWAVPDDFDVWDAPISSYSYVDVAAVPPDREQSGVNSSGQRNVSIHIVINTNKILLIKFSSNFTLAVSEVEFFTCTGKSC